MQLFVILTKTDINQLVLFAKQRGEKSEKIKRGVDVA